MKIEERGYRPSDPEDERRNVLEDLILSNNFDEVFQALKHILIRERQKAVFQDLVFLRERQDRYYTEKTEYEIPEEVLED